MADSRYAHGKGDSKSCSENQGLADHFGATRRTLWSSCWNLYSVWRNSIIERNAQNKWWSRFWTRASRPSRLYGFDGENDLNDLGYHFHSFSWAYLQSWLCLLPHCTALADELLSVRPVVGVSRLEVGSRWTAPCGGIKELVIQIWQYPHLT